jgi:hypothetical protein
VIVILQEVLESSLEKLAQSIAKEHQLECNILWTEGFQTNENNKKQQITSELLQNNDFEVLEKNSFYLGKILAFLQHPGAMFGLGSGITTPALHNQTTIFLMTLSVRGFPFFHQISKEITNAH